ncbi:hypothetical protein JXA48_03340 [Candidatus Woesearchaeota archaeon]|nr:hypothetical protein [Candidatus Woesearchaeota archaeon]
MKAEELYSEQELYPKHIVSMLGELGASAEEQSIIEQYLWSTFGGEPIDL